MKTFKSVNLFITFELTYIIFLAIGFIASSSAVKAVSNGYAVLCLLMPALYFVLIRVRRLGQFDRSVLVASIVLFCCNLLANFGSADLLESIKIVSIFIFYLAGRSVNESFFQRKLSLYRTFAFIGLPMLVALPSAFFSVDSGDLSAPQTVGIFVNRNNAALFFIFSSILLVLRGSSMVVTMVYVLCCALIFKTLGALLAAVVSILLIFLKPKSFFLVLLFCAFGFSILYFGRDLEIVQRISTVATSSFDVIGAAGDISGLDRMSYAEISTVAGTSDVSFIFRLKHWINLLSIYQEASFQNMLFGLGVGSSVSLSEAGLVPHNDYVRMFFELGPGIFIIYLLVNLKIILSLGRQLLTIPFLFIFIYAASENIVNNFLVMSFVYVFAGALTRRAQIIKKNRSL